LKNYIAQYTYTYMCAILYTYNIYTYTYIHVLNFQLIVPSSIRSPCDRSIMMLQKKHTLRYVGCFPTTYTGDTVCNTVSTSVNETHWYTLFHTNGYCVIQCRLCT